LIQKGAGFVADRNPLEDGLSGVQIVKDCTSSLHFVKLRGNPSLLASRFVAATGCAWPLIPNTASGSACAILWLSPCEWLIVNGTRFIGPLQKACEGYLQHVSDVTDGRVVFRLSGTASRELLARGCSLDFHPRVFGPGQCAQTLLAQIPVLVHQRSNEPAFFIYADVSFGAYLTGWFADAKVC
jgi:sarcosine oxidase subunit gamma